MTENCMASLRIYCSDDEGRVVPDGETTSFVIKVRVDADLVVGESDGTTTITNTGIGALRRHMSGIVCTPTSKYAKASAGRTSGASARRKQSFARRRRCSPDPVKWSRRNTSP